MKKVWMLLFLVTTLFVLNNQVLNAQSQSYAIEFSFMFDSENISDSMDFEMEYGTRIALSENDLDIEGYTFEFWIVNGNVRSDLPQSHAFVVTNDMDITAVYRNDKHAVVFMDTNIDRLDVQYIENEGTASDAGITPPDKPGYVPLEGEARWSGSLNNITESQVLILQYQRSNDAEFTLTVDGGTAESSTYTYNDVATVTAGPPSAGESFSHWEADGVIVSFDASYTFSMLESRHVTAVFSDTPEDERPLISLSDAMELRTGNDSYLAQMTIPDGYTLIDYGVLTSEDPMLNENMTVDSENVTRRPSSSYHGPTNEFLVTFHNTPGAVRAYMVLEDEEDELVRVYSDVPQLQTLFRTEYGTVFGQDAFIHYRLLIDGHEVQDWTTNPATYIEGQQGNEDFNWEYENHFQEDVTIEWKMLIRQDGEPDIWMPDPDRFNQSGQAHFSSWDNAVNEFETLAD